MAHLTSSGDYHLSSISTPTTTGFLGSAQVCAKAALTVFRGRSVSSEVQVPMASPMSYNGTKGE